MDNASDPQLDHVSFLLVTAYSDETFEDTPATYERALEHYHRLGGTGDVTPQDIREHTMDMIGKYKDLVWSEILRDLGYPA